MARKYTVNKTNEYRVGDLVLDTDARTVTRGGEPVELTSKEFALLEYMVRNRGISFDTDIEDGIMCRFNASLISRAVYNLLQNAYKYGRDNGYVRLSLTKQGSNAVLSVEDNGIGISAEDQDKIWQRFWQADNARSAEKGSGLGLAMVKEIAELHGGTVNVESTLGRGSTFTITIPAV